MNGSFDSGSLKVVKRKRIIAFYLLFLVVITVSTADILTLSLIQNATDNLFQNKDAHADMVSLFGFYIDKDFTRTSSFVQGGYNSLWENPFTYIEDYYMIENPSYHSYSWEGLQWEAVITAVLSWNIELKIGYNFFNRSFPGIDVLNEERETTGEMREDIRRLVLFLIIFPLLLRVSMILIIST
jgi:hypothetical protein